MLRLKRFWIFTKKLLLVSSFLLTIPIVGEEASSEEPGEKASALLFHNIQLHYDPSHEPFEPDGITTLTAEHLGIYKYGTVFSFLDVESGDDDLAQTESMYFELSPVINAFEMGPVGLGIQPVQFNTLRIANFSSNAYLIGPVLQFSKLSSAFVNMQVYFLAKKDTSYDDIAPQVTLAWETSRWHGFMLAGFFDLWFQPDPAGPDNHMVIITEPQLLWNLGILSKSMDSFYLGFEAELTHNLYLPNDELYFNPTVFIRADF